MKPKKNPKADLEKKRVLFFEIGFALAFAAVLIAFNWRVDVSEQKVLEGVNLEDIEEEMVPITRQEKEQPKPEVKPLVKFENLFEIVDNEEDIEEDLEIIDSDTDQDEEVEIRQVTEEEEEIDETTPFVKVEQMPIFRPEKNKNREEGDKDLYIYVNSSVKYPVIAQENGVQGRVFVQFVVNENGDVTNVKILSSPDESLSKEAVKVVENLPKFRPGMQRNRPVKVYYSVLIRFVLQ